MSDPYLEAIDQQWDNIVMMYRAFEAKKPIIEFDIVTLRILAYPAGEYLEGLSDRTREQTKREYEEAVAKGAIMLFVRDELNEVLRSYVFPPTES